MTKKLLRRDILLVFLPIMVILLTAVAVVAMQSRASVKAPSQDAVLIKGEAVCLPHKDTNGPQTMECAFGLKDEKGQYYALSDTDPAYRNITDLPMGEKIEVKGTFEGGESKTYSSIGTIKVTNVTRR